MPAVGDRRQPLWPAPWYGSISHCERCALAVVSAGPVGVDIERILSPTLATELESSIVNNAGKKPAGRQRPAVGRWPLTLAFSAKESAFKASPPEIQSGVGFRDFEVTYIKEGNLAASALRRGVSSAVD